LCCRASATATAEGETTAASRRLFEAGCDFVTLQYGGWEMHGNIRNVMKRRAHTNPADRHRRVRPHAQNQQ